ncbi:LOW QUALITY PROTEIN: hypothetical protein QYF61_005617 [Mycteria americana]|uniref:RNase H type-1 domain-containing protein n=1 Tax=Mycteria americana TaxID=33587 RepID=A0AAN7RR48_MYCAM|nr:LOW QUALITY PROTEIN: hypothetical protein QYF61_005617 [Mycteria americana]
MILKVFSNLYDSVILYCGKTSEMESSCMESYTTKTAEGEGESSQFAEVKAIQVALDIAERKKWPVFYLCTDSWMVANALWGWLQQGKQSNWQHRGKPIWAAALLQNIAAQVKNLVVKVCHLGAHVPKSQATEEHQNNQQVDQAAKIEVAQVDLDWQHKGELFIARWAHDPSGHQGRDATYRWAHDGGVDLTMDTIAQVIHECETCAAIKQAKGLKPLWYGGGWLKCGEASTHGRLIISHSHKPTKASAMCLQCWKQPPDGWKHVPCPMAPPRTLSWALKSKSCGDMEPQKALTPLPYPQLVKTNNREVAEASSSGASTIRSGAL